MAVPRRLLLALGVLPIHARAGPGVDMNVGHFPVHADPVNLRHPADGEEEILDAHPFDGDVGGDPMVCWPGVFFFASMG